MSGNPETLARSENSSVLGGVDDDRISSELPGKLKGDERSKGRGVFSETPAQEIIAHCLIDAIHAGGNRPEKPSPAHKQIEPLKRDLARGENVFYALSPEGTFLQDSGSSL